jgi:hypothetical protein
MKEDANLHSFGILMLNDEYVVHTFESSVQTNPSSPMQRVALILTPQRLIYTSGNRKQFNLRAALLSDVPYIELRHRARQIWLLLLGIGLLASAYFLMALDDRTFREIADDPFTWQVIGAAAQAIGALVAVIVYFTGGRTELAPGPSSDRLGVTVGSDQLEDARDFIRAFFVAKMNLQRAKSPQSVA